MSNSEIDFDTLLPTGDKREVFDPVSKGAWPGVSSHVYVSTHRSGPDDAIQIGYDPELKKSFVRAIAGGPEARWGTWVAVDVPPPPDPVEKKSKAAKDEEPEAPTPKKK